MQAGANAPEEFLERTNEFERMTLIHLKQNPGGRRHHPLFFCLQAGAKAPEEFLERTNEFERMYIEQGKVMHRDQFTQLYNMLGYEAPHGDDAWSEDGPKNVNKPAYVIPGREMASRLGGTRHIRKEGATFEYQVVDRWVRAGLRYDDYYGLEEVSEEEWGRVSVDRAGEREDPKVLVYNGIELQARRDGLRQVPRGNIIRLMERIRAEKEEAENGTEAGGTSRGAEEARSEAGTDESGFVSDASHEKLGENGFGGEGHLEDGNEGIEEFRSVDLWEKNRSTARQAALKSTG